MYSSRTLLGLVTLMAFAGMIASACPAQAGKTEFDVGLYGWMPVINGNLTYDIPGVGDQVTVDPGTLIDNLSFTAMGMFNVKRNGWSVFADVIYLKETKSGTKTLDIGEGIGLTSDLALSTWIVTFGVGAEVYRSPDGTVIDVGLGARYFTADTKLDLAPSGPLAEDFSNHSTNNIWNGIIGGKARFALGKRWYIPVQLDLGTGDSDFVWQGMGGIGYGFNWGRIAAGYRYLDFDQGTEQELSSLTMGGFEIGIAFHF